MLYCGVHYLWFAFVCFLIRSHPLFATAFRSVHHVVCRWSLEGKR